MPLVDSRKMLQDARQGGYAVGAFNVENMEMVKAVIQAAGEMESPVILQTTPSTIRYGGAAVYASIVSAEAARTPVPVCLHLDHGSSYELAEECLEAGYRSVMIDGSGLPFEQNIELAAKVTAKAREYSVPVEAELGKVGGKEDDHEAESDGNTDPAEAEQYVRETGIDSLAVAIGTAHGFYKGTPVLDKDRLTEIRSRVEIPLVLHGASGLSDAEVEACVERGICKVNFATELRVAYTEAVKELLAEKPEVFDPKELGIAGMKAVTALVKHKIAVCTSAGKGMIVQKGIEEV